jgi:hypothetical protein
MKVMGIYKVKLPQNIKVICAIEDISNFKSIKEEYKDYYSNIGYRKILEKPMNDKINYIVYGN